VFVFQKSAAPTALPTRHHDLFDAGGESKLCHTTEFIGMALLRILHATTPVLRAIEFGYGWPFWRQLPYEVGISSALSQGLKWPTKDAMWMEVDERKKWLLNMEVFKGATHETNETNERTEQTK
jgi:hypothetical protein